MNNKIHFLHNEKNKYNIRYKFSSSNLLNSKNDLKTKILSLNCFNKPKYLYAKLINKNNKIIKRANSSIIKPTKLELKNDNYNKQSENFNSNDSISYLKNINKKIKNFVELKEKDLKKKYFYISENNKISNIIKRNNNNKFINKKMYNTYNEKKNCKSHITNHKNYYLKKYNSDKKFFISKIKNKYELLNSNKLKESKTFKKSKYNINSNYKSESNLFKDYNNSNQIFNLKSKEISMKKTNNLSRNNSMGFKSKIKSTDWKNCILESIISNITDNLDKKANDLFFFNQDQDYHHNNIKMFTILDLYNKKIKNI